MIEQNYTTREMNYIGHFSHWFRWGVMLYERFVINQSLQEGREALTLHDESGL